MTNHDPATVHLRPMAEADLVVTHRLSQDVGWPHRQDDWRLLLNVGEGVVASEAGDIAGTAMWWQFPGRIARLGMVIVDPARQKAGIGRTLMRHLLEVLGEQTIILNATAAGVPLYRRLDFEPVGSIMQHQGIAAPLPAPLLASDERLRPFKASDAANVIAIDAAAARTNRAGIIEEVLRDGDFMVLETGGGITGFACCRPFGRGLLIGPVVARDVRAAKILISHWLSTHAGKFVRIDVPEDAGMAAWLSEQALVEIAPAFTMVRGACLPPSDTFRAFGLVNQALG